MPPAPPNAYPLTGQIRLANPNARNMISSYIDSSDNKHTELNSNVFILNDLDVNGDSSISGEALSDTLKVENLSILKGEVKCLSNCDISGELTVESKTKLQDELEVNKKSTLKGEVICLSNCDILGELTVEKKTKLQDELVVDKKSILKDKVECENNCDISGELLVKSKARLQDELVVDKKSILKDKVECENNCDISGELTVESMTKLQDELEVNKKSTFKAKVVCKNNCDISGELMVDDRTTLKGKLIVDDNAEISGNLDVCGNITCNKLFTVEKSETEIDVNGDGNFNGGVSCEYLSPAPKLYGNTLGAPTDNTIDRREWYALNEPGEAITIQNIGKSWHVINKVGSYNATQSANEASSNNFSLNTSPAGSWDSNIHTEFVVLKYNKESGKSIHCVNEHSTGYDQFIVIPEPDASGLTTRQLTFKNIGASSNIYITCKNVNPNSDEIENTIPGGKKWRNTGPAPPVVDM